VEATYEGKMLYMRLSDVHIHYECLYSASRSPKESVSQLVQRIAGNHKRLINCKHCKQKVGSVGCVIQTCPKIYHYKCAIESGGKWDSGSRAFYCKDHYIAQNNDLIPTYKLITKWPVRTRVRYLRDNIWDEIKSTHRDYIARWARVDGPRVKNEDDTWTVAWEAQDFTPRIEIREIGPGHWAWCSDLGSGQKTTRSRQFEAIAAGDIKKDDFIGEYVGRVRYENPSTLRNPYVTSILVPANLKFRTKMGKEFAGLCIDSSAEGNETRFINSVTRQSPIHIKQNATMNTVWCRGQLRVIISAKKFIPKGGPIVLNYDEYIKEDGSHPYFDSDSESEEPQTPYFVNNILLPISTVVVPFISEGYQHPKKKKKK